MRVADAALAAIGAAGIGTGLAFVFRRPRPRAVTPEQRQRMLALWSERGYPPGEVARTIQWESGWRTNADNHAGYVGLFQMGAPARKFAGFTGDAEDFAELPFEEQWPFYQRFVRGLPRWQLPGDSHLVLFLPQHIRAPDDQVLAPVGSLWWKANPSLRPGWDPHTNPNPHTAITAGSVRATVAPQPGQQP